MKKRIFSLLLAAFWICFAPLAVHAFETDFASVVDHAGLLSSKEETSLETKALQLRQQLQMDVVILTVNSTDGHSPQRYANEFYDRNGYADDGILLLVSMEERDWYICTTGKAQDIFTEYGIEQLGDTFVPYLSSGDYATAFGTYLDALPGYWEAYQNGEPIKESIGFSHVLICLCIGIAVGGGVLLIMRSAMKTDKPQLAASQYIKDGSFRLNVVHDQYLYSRVSKTPKQTNSSGGHGGGGRSHGGGGGKF